MSLITRCPACGTMFKVVPDQLRISEGWVRCGHCAEIFDATASLHQPEPEAGASSMQATSAAPVAQPDALEAAPPPPAPAPTPSPIPIPVTRPTDVEASAEAPDSIAAPPLYPWFPSEVRDSQIERDSQLERQLLDEEPDLDDVSFVRHARRKAFWRRPLVRAMLFLMVLLLGGTLGVQYAVQERDKLAALHPALRPWLQVLCEPLRCQVRPPRQIDAIVVDSSSFIKLRTDAYRLTFTLRNQGPMQVAMPSIELTLTDAQDQPLIRRVLAPEDVGASAVIAAASESNGSIAVSVAANGSTGRVAGYRLLAFYP